MARGPLILSGLALSMIAEIANYLTTTMVSSEEYTSHMYAKPCMSSTLHLVKQKERRCIVQGVTISVKLFLDGIENKSVKYT